MTCQTTSSKEHRFQYLDSRLTIATISLGGMRPTMIRWTSRGNDCNDISIS